MSTRNKQGPSNSFTYRIAIKRVHNPQGQLVAEPSSSAANQSCFASLGVSKELVDSWHDLGGLVVHKASEAMHGVTPPLLMVLKHAGCPPCLVLSCSAPHAYALSWRRLGDRRRRRRHHAPPGLHRRQTPPTDTSASVIIVPVPFCQRVPLPQKDNTRISHGKTWDFRPQQCTEIK